jgi:hypothetical protein
MFHSVSLDLKFGSIEVYLEHWQTIYKIIIKFKFDDSDEHDLPSDRF